MSEGMFIVKALIMKVIRRIIINQKEVFLFGWLRLERLFLILTGCASAFMSSIFMSTGFGLLDSFYYIVRTLASAICFLLW